MYIERVLIRHDHNMSNQIEEVARSISESNHYIHQSLYAFVQVYRVLETRQKAWSQISDRQRHDRDTGNGIVDDGEQGSLGKG